MVSDRSEMKDVTLARDSGATEFLVKTVTAKALTDRLARVIFEPRPFVRSKSFFGPDRRRKDENFPPPDKRDVPPE